MASRTFRTLELRINKLKKHFLPKKTSLTGDYSLRQTDLMRGFRLLAHAEMESYLEERATAVAAAAVARYHNTAEPDEVILHLVAFYTNKSDLSEGEFKRIYDNMQNHPRAVLGKASKTFARRVGTNHGIREYNILQLLLPVGFDVNDIDATWLASMNSFGLSRGAVAHGTYKAQQTIDPVAERKTVDDLLKGMEKIDARFSALM
jgi:hypothetical protein